MTTVSGDSLTWSRAVATGCTADGDAELWYALDAPAAAAGTKVTVSLAGSAVVQFADVAEYRGLTARDGSAPATVEATGTVATAGPGAVTPAASGELVLSPRVPLGAAKQTKRTHVDVDAAALRAGTHHGATYYQLAAFLDAVRGRGPVQVSAGDGLAAVIIGAAAELSAREGRVVRITELDPRTGD